MPTFRITTKQRLNNNGIRIEPGMTVDVVTNSYEIIMNYKQNL